MEIAKTTVTLTILHPVDVDISEVSIFDIVDAIVTDDPCEELDFPFTGGFDTPTTRSLTKQELHEELAELGEDEDFFEESEEEDEGEDPIDEL